MKGHDSSIFLNPYFHEYDVVSVIWSLLAENDVFIDVGAHGGSYSIIASKAVDKGGKVISIEPNSENLEILRLNVELNGLENIKVVQKAVGENVGHMELYYHPANSAFTSAFLPLAIDCPAKTLRRIDVEVDTLNHVYERTIEPRNVKIIKIDTEGFDLRVLKGSENVLSKAKHLIVEQNTLEIRDLLAENGFVCETIRPSGYLFASNFDMHN